MTGGGDAGAPGDDNAARRMRIRAWRRGTREMDLVLGPYADAHLGSMDARAAAGFAALLDEDDHDINRWVTGAAAPPARHVALVADLVRFATSRHAQGGGRG